MPGGSAFGVVPGRRTQRARAALGVLLDVAAFHAVAARATAAGTVFVIEPYLRFAGQPGEQWTMFLRDPAGNALEFRGVRGRRRRVRPLTALEKRVGLVTGCHTLVRLDPVLDAIAFPTRCAGCDRPGPVLCRTRRFALVARVDDGPPGVVVAAPFTGRVRDVLLGLKYRNRRPVAAHLAGLLVNRLVAAGSGPTS